MTKTQRKKLARAALDELGIEYPMAGKGSGAKALEDILKAAEAGSRVIEAFGERGWMGTLNGDAPVIGGPENVEAFKQMADDAMNAWEHPWWVADHATERTLYAPKSVLHYGPNPPKSPPAGGGRWKKRKKPPKWLGDVGKASVFAAKLIAKILL